MAGMALLLVLAVTQDESGWTASDRDGQRLTQPGRVDLPDALPSVLQNQPPAGLRTDQSWAEIEDALSRPLDPGATSSDSYRGLRRAQGSDRPPQPPTVGPPPERGRVREWLDEEPRRQTPDAARFRSGVDEPVPRVDPRDAVRLPQGRRSTRGDDLIEVPDLEPTPEGGRDLLYEQRLADNRDDRRYLVPPSREYDDRQSGVTPVPYEDRDVSPGRDPTTNDLPPVDLPLKSPDNFADESTTDEPTTFEVQSPSNGREEPKSDPLSDGGDAREEREDSSAEPVRSSWPLIWAMVGLFGSIGFNVYLGWIAWDIHGRYQDVVDEIRELENRLDPLQPRDESPDSRRIRA